MRIGTVPYWNAFPLTTGLPCEIFKAPPANLIRQAKADDIILGPVAAAFAHPDWHLLEGVGIGSFGPVDTVRLFFREDGITIQNIKTICIDPESLTSVALLKILLAKKYKREEISLTTGTRKSAEGSLLIGNKVWDHEQKVAQVFSLDLGKEWSDWTALPFVYACWMTKNPELGKEWKSTLIDQTQKNLTELERLAPSPKIFKYWRQLCYELGPKQKSGIELFQKYWAEVERKKVFELKWI